MHTEESCLTCHGTGELVSEFGPAACPSCAGEPSTAGSWQQTERRLRDIEARYLGPAEHEGDIRWLAHELLAARQALMVILSRCQDEADSDLVLHVRFHANEALRLYRKG